MKSKGKRIRETTKLVVSILILAILAEGIIPAIAMDGNLPVSVTVNPSLVRTYSWSIEKSANPTLIDQLGGNGTFNYIVNVTEKDFTDTVTGDIIVTNPSGSDITLNSITDSVDNGGTCMVDSTSLVVPAGATLTIPFTCTYSNQQTPNSGTNTATVTDTNGISGIGTASFSFQSPTTLVNNAITVTDIFNGVTTTLGTLTATDSTFASASYQYSHTVSVPASNCNSYTNTAKIVETSQTASQTVSVCGPAKTGAQTMGFWKNNQGQKIITAYGGGTQGTTLAAYLRGLYPFTDLASDSTPSQDATYVANVLNAAQCSTDLLSGSGNIATCNYMLKAQMLATALNVYFSDPVLGGNKINAPAPIGDVFYQHGNICVMTDTSSGSTCSGTFVNAESVLGSVPYWNAEAILQYQNTQQTGDTPSNTIPGVNTETNAGLIWWYNQYKPSQVLAKNVFDAINNQVAFSQPIELT